MIVHLNGWPGVGKLTVGRALARKLGARLLDNHILHDLPGQLCDRGSAEYWRLYYQIRDLTYAWVHSMPSDESFVMTNALTREADREVEAWNAIRELARNRSDQLVAVTLECVLDENVRRIQSPDRQHRKLTAPAPLIEWRSKYTLLTDADAAPLTVDNTSLSPDQAADEIVAHVRAVVSRPR
jgi:hypothetical protein